MDLKYIIQVVNNHFDVDITENIRNRYIVMCRGVYFHFAKKTTNFSLAMGVTTIVGSSFERPRGSQVIYSSTIKSPTTHTLREEKLFGIR